MNSAILHQIHVQNLIFFLVCHIVLPEETVLVKDLMEVIMIMVTNDKVKIVSHLVTQHVIDNVLDFRNCVLGYSTTGKKIGNRGMAKNCIYSRYSVTHMDSYRSKLVF